MPTVTTLDGIASQTVQTNCINTFVLLCAAFEIPPIGLIHGKASAAIFRSFLAG